MDTDGHGLTKAMVVPITVLLLMTGQALAQPCGGYEVTAIIQTPVDCGFGFDITTGLGLNDGGAVVGYYWCSGWEHKEAFVWTADEGFVTLERPQGVVSAKAVDINDEGIICGTAAVSGVGTRGFVYGYEGDEFTILDIPPGGNTMEARGINSAGEIVGFWGDVVNGPFTLAFIWRNGKTIDIHPDFGTSRSVPSDINSKSLVTGWMGQAPQTDARAFIWENGKVTALPPIPGGFTSEGESLSNGGQLAGHGRKLDSDGSLLVRAFLWDKQEMIELGTLPGFIWSASLDITPDGSQIVGISWNVDGNPSIRSGFVWADGVIRDLNDLIPLEMSLDIHTARGINEAGQIVGSATNEFNDPVAVLLTPIEGPAGDLNNDCQVGVKDLLILLGNWGSCDTCNTCPVDLDGDCVVGVTDLLILLANWG